MNSILFYSNHLEFFFERRTSALEIIDNFFLPFSKKFLYSIYHHRRALKAPESIPRVFYREYNPERMKVTLILNLNGSFFFLPVQKIHAIHDEKENVFSFIVRIMSDKRTWNKLKRVTEDLLMFREGPLRIARSGKGAIVFSRAKEDDKEDLETIVGLLTMLTPEAIKKEYM